MRAYHEGNPYEVELVPAAAPRPAYNDLLLGTSMVRLNPDQPPEFKLNPGDTGKLAVVNPEYVGKRLAVGSLYGAGWGVHNSAAYRNRARKIKSDLEDLEEDFRLRPDRNTFSPMTQPNVLPVHYFSKMKMRAKQ